MMRIIPILLLIAIGGCAERAQSSAKEQEPCPTYKAVVDMSVPDEVKTKAAELTHCRPPEGYRAVTAWMHAIHDTLSIESSAVRVDRLRLLARANKSREPIVLADQQYNDSTEVCGGLYRRFKWYANDERTSFTNVKVDRGAALLPVSDARDRIWHLYLCKLVPLNAEYDRIWMEATVAIAGPALVQAGIDYWPSEDPNNAVHEDGCDGRRICQGATSDWYRARPGIVRIPVAEPAN
jgi:hypothetical protein